MKNQKKIKHILIEIGMLVAGMLILWTILNAININSNLNTQKIDNQTELQLVSDKLESAENTYI